jgi:hypothetical protein
MNGQQDVRKTEKVAENGVYLVEESRTFYRDSYRRIVRVAIIEAVVKIKN